MAPTTVTVPPYDSLVARFTMAAEGLGGGGVTIPSDTWFFERLYPKFFEFGLPQIQTESGIEMPNPQTMSIQSPIKMGVREFVDRFHKTMEDFIVSLGPTGDVLERTLALYTDEFIALLIPDAETAQMAQASYNLISMLAAYDRQEAATNFYKEEVNLTPIAQDGSYAEDNAESRQVAEAAHRIADLFFEYIPTWDTPIADYSAPYVQYEDRRYQDVNAFWNQTASGLFVEVDYYGLPQAVWTPWGKFDFAGSGSLYGDAVDAASKQIRQHLSLEMYYPGRPEQSEPAVYKVIAVDGVALPPAVVQPSRAEFMDRDVAHQMWVALMPADSGAAITREAKAAAKASQADKPTNTSPQSNESTSVNNTGDVSAPPPDAVTQARRGGSTGKKL